MNERAATLKVFDLVDACISRVTPPLRWKYQVERDLVLSRITNWRQQRRMNVASCSLVFVMFTQKVRSLEIGLLIISAILWEELHDNRLKH